MTRPSLLLLGPHPSFDERRPSQQESHLVGCCSLWFSPMSSPSPKKGFVWLPASGSVRLKVVLGIITLKEPAVEGPQTSVPVTTLTGPLRKKYQCRKTSSQPITKLLLRYGPLAAWPKPACLPPKVVELLVVCGPAFYSWDIQQHQTCFYRL